MQINGRLLGKPERQRLIVSIVSRKRIGTQHELLAALAAVGCDVTQATVSRDIRELGLEKGRDPLGRPRYLLPQRSRRPNPREALGAVLSQFGRRATPAQNVVVVVSELGTAPAIARAIDQTAHPLVVGTLAGDDTSLVIAASPKDARALASELTQLIQSDGTGFNGL
jgi:transcriptional regulator of arginine metabolism